MKEITEQSLVSMQVTLQRSPLLDLNNLDANVNATSESVEDEVRGCCYEVSLLVDTCAESK